MLLSGKNWGTWISLRIRLNVGGGGEKDPRAVLNNFWLLPLGIRVCNRKV